MASEPKTIEDILDLVDLRLIRPWQRWHMLGISQRLHIVDLVKGGANEGEVATYLKKKGHPSTDAVLLCEYIRAALR